MYCEDRNRTADRINNCSDRPQFIGRMDPEDAEYTCTLDEESLKVAKKEINENPKDRLSSVQTLRKWIKEQDHLRVHTDTATLLMYLRGAKYSQLRARELLQNTAEMVEKNPDWLRNVDSHEEGIQEYLKAGTHLPLPKRDKERHQLMLLRPGAISTKNKFFNPSNEIRTSIVVDRMMRESELTQVYGFVIILDFTGFTLKHMGAWSLEQTRKQMKLFQDCSPGRVKGLHFYNAGPLFEAMMGLMKPVMKKKYLDRVKTHSTLESLYKEIPMELLPEDYLPDDYKGPTIGTTKELVDGLKKRATSAEWREHILNLTSGKFGMDLDKRPKLGHSSSYRQISQD